MRMKIGILGGTFDPIHRGHLALARHALKQFKLDKVFFIPAARPPHKRNFRPGAPIKHRLAMVRLAVGKFPRLKVSDLEIKRKGHSYTVDTLKTVRRKFPEAEIYLILGQDSYEGMKHWKAPEEIRRLAYLLIARRAGSSQGRKAGTGVSWLKMPLCPASSSEIRERVKDGRKLDDYLPQMVITYIRSYRLYGHPK